MSLVKDHLDLEKIRYEERLDIRYHLDPSCMDILIPPMTLQTLVENAIKHGISKLSKGGLINISIRSKGDLVEILIENTGNVSNKDASSMGIGMQNVNRRMDLIYGTNFQLQLEQIDPDTVRATLELPKTNRL